MFILKSEWLHYDVPASDLICFVVNKCFLKSEELERDAAVLCVFRAAKDWMWSTKDRIESVKTHHRRWFIRQLKKKPLVGKCKCKHCRGCRGCMDSQVFFKKLIHLFVFTENKTFLMLLHWPLFNSAWILFFFSISNFFGFWNGACWIKFENHCTGESLERKQRCCLIKSAGMRLIFVSVQKDKKDLPARLTAVGGPDV